MAFVFNRRSTNAPKIPAKSILANYKSVLRKMGLSRKSANLWLIDCIPAAKPDRVWSIALHPTLPILATASADRSVRLYSTTTDSQIGIIEGTHKRSIRSCAWKRGEPKPILATGSFDGTVGIWDHAPVDAEDPSEGGEWECAGLLEGHENEVKCVAWSGGGTLLATCSRDKSIWIWEAENYEDPECVSVMQEHAGDVKCVVWHPTEELLASGSYDDTIRLWRDDGDDWVCCAKLEGHEGTVWAVDFEGATDGGPQRLVSGSGDETIRVWERKEEPKRVESGGIPSIIRPAMDQIWEQTAILPTQHEGTVYTVAWSKYSGKIASSGQDGKIVIYTRNGEGTWIVESETQNAHGVHEINHLLWGAVSDRGEILYSAGDDEKTNIWYCTTEAASSLASP